MPITRLQCPRCGVEVKMGLPMGATVKSVSTAARDEPPGEKLDVRSLVCQSGHEFSVTFER